MTNEQHMPHGLLPRQVGILRQILAPYAQAITRVDLFGSRSGGRYRNNSDIDLVIHGDLLEKDIDRLHTLFQESALPFSVVVKSYALTQYAPLKQHMDMTPCTLFTKDDLVLYDAGNESLQEHVRRYGVKIAGLQLEWTRHQLNEVCTDISYGYTTSATHDEMGPKFLRITDIVADYIDWNTVPTCRASEKTVEKYRLFEGDIVIARTGATTGYNKTIKNLKFEAIYASYLIRFKIDRLLADPKFIGFCLQPHWWKEFVRGIVGGSAQPNANAKQFGSYEIDLPPLNEQNKIAEVLDALDDRIQLLRETNATLEAMAQALFKSWFVDFDPVHAKAEGRTPEGMDAETAALFPAEFEESELGMIPKGWKVVSYADTVSILSGATPKTNISSYWNGNIPWFSVVDAPRQSDVFVIETEKNITEVAIENSSAKILPTGTTIISARGTVGKLAIIACQMSMNQSCYGLQGVYGDVYFTYFNTLRLVDVLKCRTHGSVFDTITRSTFEGVTSIRPHSPIVALFESSVSPLMERIKENLMLARTLTALRDTLLPRLISGKLRLPEFAGEENGASA